MIDQYEPIIAIATPPGNGAVGMLRLSGKGVVSIANQFLDKPLINARKNYLRKIIFKNRILDQCIVTCYLSPKSFTGEDMVEVFCHGNFLLLDKIVDVMAANSKLRLAEPGEFSKRAFLNNKIDLTQAEAIADIISSNSEKSLQISMRHLNGDISTFLSAIREKLIQAISLLELEIDFSHESIELIKKDELLSLIQNIQALLHNTLDAYNSFRLIEEGISITIVGKPNVGKSSLLNALLGMDRALVSKTPGTTRDYISEKIHYKGVLFNFFDTAGIRESSIEIEKSGIDRSVNLLKHSPVVIVVFDGSQKISIEDLGLINQINQLNKTNVVLAINKTDLNVVITDKTIPYDTFSNPVKKTVFLSAIKRSHIEELKESIYTIFKEDIARIDREITISNQRQFQHINRIVENLNQACLSIRNNLPAEIVSVDIRAAIDHLGEITGHISTDEILNNVFSHFCIGK